MEKLDPLQTFVEVVRAGSFAAAARALDMPRSTVSLHVKTLETALDTRLLKRSTRSIALTNDGATLFAQAEESLHRLTAAMDGVRGRLGQLSGLIRLTAPADFPTARLARAIAAFQRQHPAVRFDLMLTNAALDMIGDDVDIALRIGSRGYLDRITRRLAPVPWRFCAKPDWLDRNGVPKKVRDIRAFIAPAPELRLFLERHVLAGQCLPDGVIRTDNQRMVRDLVLAGAGIGLLPGGLCDAEIDAGRLCAVLPDATATAPPLTLTFPSRADITPRVRAFADMLAAEFH
ncbi:LysR family transcriptional regulator [Rhodovulum sulfidophilum]|uniref:LysR family transcriptional regulator n=1 Tax=Rhodovulum sulfidophilum TaxID=35806 RepID=UPI001911A926|nr:LysR family transcriptional regulator [Rhodovulum sulfidophilum]